MRSRATTSFLPVRCCAATALVALAVPMGALAGQGNDWSFAGGDRQNTRFQQSEHVLTPSNVSSLQVAWAFTTAGDVSATPATDADTVYFPDWAGYLYALNKRTGALKWVVHLPDLTHVPKDKARATPAVTDDMIIIGTQGGILAGGGPGGKLLGFNKLTGQLVWTTQLDVHPAAVITQSATVFDGRVYVGVSSLEESLALVPGYRLTFRGSMLSVDAATGRIVWKTMTAPPGYTGNALWGSSPAIDNKRGQVYVATGNNYSVPAAVLLCVAAAATDEAKAACQAPDNFVDSVLALDMKTGAVRWAMRAISYDAWTVDCIPGIGSGGNCPQPSGPDYDFAQAPALFKVKVDGKLVDQLGAGQKSGQYWALDPDTGKVLWVARSGPGGTAGGLQWGSAVDGTRIYTANANSNAIPWPPPSGTITKGMWSALDAATGRLVWQRVDPLGAGPGGGPSGPVTTANGIVFGCSLDTMGHMYALNAATGAQLWSFASGGSCLSGAAISDGMVFWGSGYSNFGFGSANTKVYGFALPQ